MLSTHDMKLLSEWYAWKSAEKGPFKFVLFIVDFEAFESKLIVDLISILWY